MEFKLPELGYDYDSLEPFIDAKTMALHYEKHHATYTKKFNEALEKHPEISEKNAEWFLANLGKIPEDIRVAVKNHGGGYVNHSFFWKILKKDVQIEGKINIAIEKEFGSFQEFKEKFSNSALGLFGSGWTWLVLNKGKLEIVNTRNQDSPLTLGKIPLLCIDVWEHAYYLKYQNRRNEYVESFFNVINWKQVEENFANATSANEA